MTKKINKTIIIGRIDSIGALTTSLDNKKVIKFDLKTTTVLKEKEHVEIYSITALNKEAEAVSKYTNVGDLCCIEGTLISDKLNKTSNSIMAEHITFLSSRPHIS